MNHKRKQVIAWWLSSILILAGLPSTSAGATFSPVGRYSQTQALLPTVQAASPSADVPWPMAGTNPLSSGIVAETGGNAASPTMRPDRTAEPTAESDWPQVQRDPQRTGYSPEVLGTNISVAWTHPFQPDKIFPQVQAIVYQGKVFVGTEGANGQTAAIYALDANDGHVVWRTPIGAPILASAAAGDSKVFFGAMDGAIYALDSSNGAQVWKKQVSIGKVSRRRLSSRITKLCSADETASSMLWTKTRVMCVGSTPLDSPILQTAAYDNGRVFFGAMTCMYTRSIHQMAPCLGRARKSKAWRSRTTGRSYIRAWSSSGQWAWAPWGLKILPWSQTLLPNRLCCRTMLPIQKTTPCPCAAITKLQG